MLTIGELLPEFCVELQELVRLSGQPELASRIPLLPIVSRCTCGESGCAHFYAAPPPTGAYGAGHANLLLAPEVGFVALDLLESAIVAVEVLDRPDVKALLDAALPLPTTPGSAALACPACGFLTIPDSSYGSYNVCDVCDWEDDGVQLANPACGGGANGESLIDAQRRSLARFPSTVTEMDGFHRAASWRPLNAEEVTAAISQRDEKYWKNSAVVTVHDCYWSKSDA